MSVAGKGWGRFPSVEGKNRMGRASAYLDIFSCCPRRQTTHLDDISPRASALDLEPFLTVGFAQRPVSCTEIDFGDSRFLAKTVA